MDRVKKDLEYVCASDRIVPEIVFADANFGILQRDVEIAKILRQLYETHKSLQSVQIYWSKSAQPHMIEMGKILGKLTHTYVAFQSLDPHVLEARGWVRGSGVFSGAVAAILAPRTFGLIFLPVFSRRSLNSASVASRASGYLAAAFFSSVGCCGGRVFGVGVLGSGSIEECQTTTHQIR